MAFPEPRDVSRRTVLIGGVAAAGAAQAQTATAWRGAFVQSGFCVGKTAPEAEIWVDGVLQGQASKRGLFVVGFDRDAKPAETIQLGKNNAKDAATIRIAPTVYDVQRIDGLPADQVTPEDPALLARIKREAEFKAEAFASRTDDDSFIHGFDWPLETFVVTGRFGNQRILNGKPSSPHYGMDLAAPTGAPIRAPQDGFVVLAATGLHYEGGLVLIDHGQGLISMYLHMSKVIATVNTPIKRGETLGLVGAEGRATGPHLCWRLKWRDRHLDPSLWVARQKLESLL